MPEGGHCSSDHYLKRNTARNIVYLKKIICYLKKLYICTVEIKRIWNIRKDLNH